MKRQKNEYSAAVPIIHRSRRKSKSAFCRRQTRSCQKSIVFLQLFGKATVRITGTPHKVPAFTVSDDELFSLFFDTAVQMHARDASLSGMSYETLREELSKTREAIMKAYKEEHPELAAAIRWERV